MSRFNPFDYGLSGPALSAKVQQLAETVDQLSEFLPYLPALIKSVKEPKAPGITVFPAVITGYKSISAGSNKWLYSWVEYLPDAPYPSENPVNGIMRNSASSTADNFALPAVNGLERGNFGSNGSYDGVGPRIGDILDSTGSVVIATSTMLPIGVGTTENLVGPAQCQRKQVVMMTELPYEVGGYRHWFTASNAIYVECAE
jgi:hypothetical protein